MNLVRTFQIVAVLLAFIAIYFAITDPRSDYLFAAVILAICAGFLAYRFHLKGHLEAQRHATDDPDAKEN